MSLIENFFSQISNVLQSGVFGISLNNIGIIIISLIIALLIRGIFAKIVVLKLRKIVKKTSNNIDDKLFDALIPPFKLYLL